MTDMGTIHGDNLWFTMIQSNDELVTIDMQVITVNRTIDECDIDIYHTSIIEDKYVFFTTYVYIVMVF